MNKPSFLLNTDRLILRGPIESDVLKLEAFDSRNTNRLSPWKSTEPGGKLDYASQVMKWKQEFEDGKAIRFLLVSRADPEGEIIGFCNFSQIFRGPFQACYLGYQLGGAHEGKGLMSEAIQKAVKYMFEELPPERRKILFSGNGWQVPCHRLSNSSLGLGIKGRDCADQRELCNGLSLLKCRSGSGINIKTKTPCEQKRLAAHQF